ncbi:MAG TPA: hypothetical protein VEF76_05360 [Patescibacteria group bacterium]|nr:hypothetical protein [Patescibacteria group bacterium]
MGLFKRKLREEFNTPPQRDLQPFKITLTKPAADLAAQGADFKRRLGRWLERQGDMHKGNAVAPDAGVTTTHATVSISCTEETIARIERQFGGEILRVDPPAKHVRGAIYPQPVDPWDVSKWSTPRP